MFFLNRYFYRRVITFLSLSPSLFLLFLIFSQAVFAKQVASSLNHEPLNEYQSILCQQLTTQREQAILNSTLDQIDFPDRSSSYCFSTEENFIFAAYKIASHQLKNMKSKHSATNPNQENKDKKTSMLSIPDCQLDKEMSYNKKEIVDYIKNSKDIVEMFSEDCVSAVKENIKRYEKIEIENQNSINASKQQQQQLKAQMKKVMARCKNALTLNYYKLPTDIQLPIILNDPYINMIPEAFSHYDSLRDEVNWLEDHGRIKIMNLMETTLGKYCPKPMLLWLTMD